MGARDGRVREVAGALIVRLQRRTAVEAGVVIAEGTPAEVRADPLVIASYWGAEDAGGTTRNAPRMNG